VQVVATAGATTPQIIQRRGATNQGGAAPAFRLGTGNDDRAGRVIDGETPAWNSNRWNEA